MKKKPDDVLDEVPELKEAVESACRPHRPRPANGKHAAAAVRARADMTALHDEVFAVQYAITSAREAGKP